MKTQYGFGNYSTDKEIDNASKAIFALLEADMDADTFQTTNEIPDLTRFIHPFESPLMRDINAFRFITPEYQKQKKESEIVKKIGDKLRLTQQIAGILQPESYSIGVSFPLGIQVSFSWPCQK